MALGVCTDAETYGSCGAGERQAYNFERIFNIERYADVESNPYVFGSAAFNLAHGLPLPVGDYLDRREALFEASRVAGAVNGPMSTALMSPGQGMTIATGNDQVGGLSLATLAIAALVLWAVFK